MSRTRSLVTTSWSRRDFLRISGAGAVTLGMMMVSPSLLARSRPWARHDAIMELLDGAEPDTSGVTLELPSVSEDGSNISLTVRVDSAQENGEYVKSIHLFAPDNPNPEIAVFHLTPLSGQAQIATRIRLNESQRVFAVAKLSDGSFRIGSQDARVTVSGCLTDDATYDSSGLMQARVRTPRSLRPGEVGEVLTIINHPMETGFREDADGNTIPRRIIHSFVAELDGETVLRADFHPSLAANPYLRFHVKPNGSGGTLALEWTDDEGETTREEAELSVS
ncbi:MAG: thiosulfate oxidation carrier complex protein SoxZ [Ectothiorhodospiraceae bacterium]|nr:thiosulfate oxidation carrier complex protein SoxZ [Ectothiorhodospiraceae bacterium]MCH8504643.1 thiosulfate oxidation carrier complex protein SoxZ [Ectothiorhodospiraceae bacterium]